MQPINTTIYGICGRRRGGEISATLIILRSSATSSLQHRIEGNQKVVYDDDYLYLSLNDNTNDLMSLVKIKQDFSSIEKKDIRFSDAFDFTHSSADFSKTDKSELLFMARYTDSRQTYLFNYDVNPFSSSANQFPNKRGSALQVNFPRGLILDSAGNVIIYGYASGTDTNNYLKYDSTKTYVSNKTFPTVDIYYAIYANGAMHGLAVSGDKGLYKVDTTADTIDAFYSFSKATYTFDHGTVFYDSSNNFYISGWSTDGSSTKRVHVVQLSQDITEKNYDKFFEVSGTDSACRGVFEFDNFIFAVGYTDDGVDRFGLILKLSKTDLSLQQSIKLQDTFNHNIYLSQGCDVNNSIVIYANIVNSSGNAQGSIIKIDGSDLSLLAGQSDATGRFVFSNVTVIETDAATTYASSAKSFTTPLIYDGYAYTDESGVSNATFTEYDFE